MSFLKLDSIGNYSYNSSANAKNFKERHTFYTVYRNPLIYGPIKWSNLPLETQNTFYKFYDINCPETEDIHRSKLVVEGNFNDNRIAPESNVPEWLLPYIDYKTKGKLEWDIRGLLYGLKSFEQLSATATGCGHSGYHNSCRQFMDIFTKYPEMIYAKNVLVVGSITPWIEIILMHFNANVTTTDYNVPKLSNPENITFDKKRVALQIVSIHELFAAHTQFKYDVIVSYSSLEHDGLGRYGDPLNPNGDFASMEEFYHLLKNEGTAYLLLSIPLSARDYIIWNSHRFYGRCRFENLIQNKFEVQEAFGSNDNQRFIPLSSFQNGSIFTESKGNDGSNQPLIILKKI